MNSGDNAGRGRGFQRTNFNANERMRRPNSNTLDQMIYSTQNMNINDDNGRQNNLIKAAGDMNRAVIDTSNSIKSTLNPNACEFVPRGFTMNSNNNNNNNSNNQSDILSSMNNSVEDSLSSTDEHINEYFNDYDRGDSEPVYDDFLLLSELKDFIDLISSRPDQYENFVYQVTESMNRWTNDDEDLMLVCVVNTIVDQAILDTNFRYNGVRFCVHLMENFCITTSIGTFKDVLLQRCQREYGRRESMAVATDGGLYLRGVTLFIADLSTHLQNLINYLPDLIITLLDRSTTDNIKCACMTLKLCGEVLERQNKEKFEQLMNRLETFNSNPTITANLKSLINTVIQLRNNKWKTVQTVSTIPNPYLNQEDPSGHHPQQYQQYNNFEGPSYDFGHCGDENSEDVCSAFDEFLRCTGQMD